MPDKRCASCKTDNHASWSRLCPTFLQKLNEFNSRNPDNSLQFFPTADPWTWSARDKFLPSLTRTQRLQMSDPSKRQLEKRPQQSRRPADTHVPTQQPRRQMDTHITNYFKNFNLADYALVNTDTAGWGEDPGQSNARSSDPSTSAQHNGRGSDSSSSNSNPNPGSTPNRSQEPSPSDA